MSNVTLRRVVLATSGVALMVLMAACSRSAPAAAPAAPAVSSDEKKAPDFQIATLDGSAFSLSAQQGKPVVLFFMSSNGCANCAIEARELAKLHETYASRNLQILGIDMDPGATVDSLGYFRQVANGTKLQWALDTGSRVTLAYGVRALDTTLVIDPAGRIVYRTDGPTNYDALKPVVERTFSHD